MLPCGAAFDARGVLSVARLVHALHEARLGATGSLPRPDQPAVPFGPDGGTPVTPPASAAGWSRRQYLQLAHLYAIEVLLKEMREVAGGPREWAVRGGWAPEGKGWKWWSEWGGAGGRGRLL